MTDVKIRQGTDGGLQWPVLNPDNTPFDLSGYTIVAQIRSRQNTLLHTFSTLLGNASILGSTILLSWTHEETSEWTWRTGYYQIEATSSDDQVIPIDRGFVEVIPEIVW